METNSGNHTVVRVCYVLLFVCLSYYGCTQPCTTCVSVPCDFICNGGFEDHVGCPVTHATPFGEISRACRWDNALPNATGSSADYFHPCNTNGILDIPNNHFGTGQDDHTPGPNAAYAGIVCYNDNTTFINYRNSREYIQQQLVTPLQAGKKYLVSFWVLLGSHSNWSVNQMGMNLSATPVDQPDRYNPISSVTPQIQHNPATQLDNKLSWTLISGCFTSLGNEQFITIGNFYDTTNTNEVIHATGAQYYAYYFIDDVSIQEITLGGDVTSSCANSVVPIGLSCSLNIPGITYSWSSVPAGGTYTATPTITVSPTVTTTYTLTVTGPSGCILTDDIVVTPSSGSTGCNIISNEEFDGRINPAGPYIDGFGLNNVCFWNRSYNTPDDISQTLPGGAIKNYARMWWTHNPVPPNTSDEGEVIYQTLQPTKKIEAGKKYVLTTSVRNSVDLLTNTLSSFYIKASNTTSYSTVALGTTTPGTTQTLYEGGSIPYTNLAADPNWNTICAVFTADATYNHVFVYPKQTAANIGQGWLMMDYLNIYPFDAGADQSDALGCATGFTIGHTACAIPGAMYTWSSIPAGGPYAATPTITVSPNVTTTYTLTLTLPNGCTVTDDVIVSIDGCSIVRNGSFECYSPSPPNITGEIMKAPNWTAAALGIPNFYHAHAAGGSPVDVPQPGGQSPHLLNGMAGITAYTGNASPNVRDYLQQQLSTPLTAGTYYIEFWVSRKSNSRYVIRDMGMHISATPVGNGTSLPLTTVIPQIINSPASFLTNTWTRISGCFTAVGGEQFITIGNFKNDATTTASNTGGPVNEAYYFIDDVSIRKLEINESADATIQCGNNIPLSASMVTSCGGVVSASYNWSPSTGLNNATIFNPTASPTSNTAYTVTATMNGTGCVVQDIVSINVTPLPPIYVTFTMCIDHVGINLIEGYVPGAGTLTLNGAPFNGYFVPADHGAGLHNVTYVSNNICPVTYIFNITVDPTPVIFPPIPPVSFCSTNLVPLNMAPSSGIPGCDYYDGPGVVYDPGTDTYWFDPVIAGVGTHTITYYYLTCLVMNFKCEITQTIVVEPCDFARQALSVPTGYSISNSVAVHKGSGDVYITGRFTNSTDFGAGITLTGNGLFVAKYNSCGEIQWAINDPVHTTFSEGLGIDVDDHGNAYVTGRFTGTLEFGPHSITSVGVVPGQDIFIAKFDHNGDAQWLCQGGATDGNDAGTAIAVSPGGDDVFVTGYVMGEASIGCSPVSLPFTHAFQNVFISRHIGHTGDVNWAHNYDGRTGSSGTGIAIDKNDPSIVYTTGWFNDMVDFDPGNSITVNTGSGGGTQAFLTSVEINTPQYNWAVNSVAPVSGGNTWSYDVATDNAGFIVITGGYQKISEFPGQPPVASVTTNARDMFVTKYDAGGNPQWVVSEGGDKGDEGLSVCIDNELSIYTTGYFGSNDGFTLTCTDLTGYGQKDVYVNKYNAAGNCWAVDLTKDFGDVANDQGNAIAINVEEGNAFVTGNFSGASAVFGTLVPLTLSTPAADEIFLKKLCDATGQFKLAQATSTASETVGEIQFLPNPTTGIGTLQWKLLHPDDLTVHITDMYGKTVFYKTILQTNSASMNVDLQHVSTGIYLVHVNGKCVNQTIKLIKE